MSDRYLPADDDLLRGWVGPIEWQGVSDGPWRRGVWGPLGASSERPTWGIVTSTDGHDVGYAKRLDPHRPEVAALLLRWLAEGERCPVCIEGQVSNPAACYTGDAPVDACPRCSGSGYLRRPAPAHHLHPRWLGGALSDEDAGDALAWSVRSAQAGGGVLRGVQGRWFPDAVLAATWWRASLCGAPLNMLVTPSEGWEIIAPGSPGMVLAHGPETGDAGKAAADAAALAAGFALQNPDGTMTFPEIREVPHE